MTEPAPGQAKPLAVVTGASSGIGFELAKVFAENGFDVLVNAENGRLGAAAEQLRATGAGVQPVHADLSSYGDDPAQVAHQSFDALMSGRGKIIAGSAKTKAQGVAGKAVPDKLKAPAHRQMAEPGSGE